MAELLKDTIAIANGINEVIRQAEVQIVIVTPYFKLREGNTLQNLLQFSKQPIILVVRADQKQDPIQENRRWLQQLNNLRLYQKERLHTKCYVNEKQAIVTSQNLWENTQKSNWELGVKLTKEKDAEAYADLSEEIRLLLAASQTIELNAVIAPKGKASLSKPTRQTTPFQPTTYQPIRTANSGHCIRCHKSLELNAESPYCYPCYQKWRQASGNPQEKERYCHQCGRPHEATLNHPRCYSCYRRNPQLTANS